MWFEQMNEAAVLTESLGKLYSLRQQRGQTDLREAVMNKIRLPFLDPASGSGRDGPNWYPLSERSVWALREVSIEIKRGEMVGILGRNGSGKTTLLRILSRITHPTEGYVRTRGRVTALLRAGAGLHAELTGRENIYLNGAIHGMTRMQCKERLDEIVAFAELEPFVDTPVKHYSSGMCVRLSFAVAAHVDSEIFLLDEVLALADRAFQKKCTEKLVAAARLGRAAVFVSHNLGHVRELCGRAIVLVSGRVVKSAPTSQAINHYLGLSTSAAHLGPNGYTVAEELH